MCLFIHLSIYVYRYTYIYRMQFVEYICIIDRYIYIYTICYIYIYILWMNSSNSLQQLEKRLLGSSWGEFPESPSAMVRSHEPSTIAEVTSHDHLPITSVLFPKLLGALGHHGTCHSSLVTVFSAQTCDFKG